jgi:4-amino-4-deoxy-L-arabinose transferase
MKRFLLSISCIYIIVYILPLGALPAFISDETRYGEISREMIATGDYIVPRINGLRYFEKPALGYWLNALSIRLFGENAFAIRFPSAVSAGLTAFLVYVTGAIFAGGMTAGFLSATIFLTFIHVFVIGQSSVLDSMFSLFVTASMVAFLFADASMQNRRKRLFYLMVFGGLVGLAFLVKGFIAVVIPIVSIVPFLIWEKRTGDIFRIFWLPITVAVLVCLPWSMAIHLKEPGYWKFFIVHEHIQRFLGKDAQHRVSFWFFIMLLPALALPWTFLFPAAMSGLKKRGVNEKIVKFLICWFVFPFLFFSASKGKLSTYILPCFPPLALLFALGLDAYIKTGGKKLITYGACAAGAVMVLLIVALILLQSFGPVHLKPYAQSWKAVLAGGGLMAWALFSFMSASADKGYRSLALFCMTPLAFMFVAHFAIPERVLIEKAPGSFLLKNAAYIHPETEIVSGAYLTTAVNWCYKRSDVYLLGSPGELSYGLEYPDSKERQLNFESFKTLVVKQHAKNERVVLVEDQDRYKKIEKDLPPPVFIDMNGHFLFALF